MPFSTYPLSVACDREAVALRERPERLREGRVVVAGPPDRGPGRVFPSTQGEGRFGHPHLEAAPQGLTHRRGRRGTPGNQVGHLRLRKRCGSALGGLQAEACRRDGARARVGAGAPGRGQNGHTLHVERSGQAPGRDVVDLIGEAHLAPPVLLLDEGLVHRGLGLEEVAHHAGRGLDRGYDVGSRRQGARACLQRLEGTPHLDAVGDEDIGEPRGPRRVGSGQEQVLAHRRLLGVGHRRATVGQEVAEQLLAAPGGGGGGGEGGREVVDDAVPVGEPRVVAPSQDEAAGAPLLEGHADRALVERPALAVAGIERVEDLAHEVGEAAGVEAARDRLPQLLPPGLLGGGQVGIEGIRGRGEEVGRVAAHLVQVGGHLGKPVEEDAHPAAALRLAEGEPVAIQVEEIVVAAAARPRLVVLERHGLGIGGCGLPGSVRGQEAGPAVGVFARVDEDDRLAEDLLHLGIALGGEQVVGQGQRGIARRDLVAMHAVEQPGHGGKLLDQAIAVSRREPAGIAELAQARLHLVETRHPLGRADGEHVERAPLPGLRVLREPGALGRGLGQRLQVRGDLLRRGYGFARLVAHHLLQGGDARVVACPGPELGRRGRGGESEQKGRDHRGTLPRRRRSSFVSGPCGPRP